jgi:uncharacterized protein (TIGR02145 family)
MIMRASILFFLCLLTAGFPGVGRSQEAQVDFSALSRGRVSDADNNVYPTILFGDTWWLAENLRTYRFNDGTALTHYKDTEHKDYMAQYDTKYSTGGSGYDGLKVEGHFAYPMRNLKLVASYGLLYPYYAAVNERGLCPPGWSFPDTADWFNLARLLVGEEAFEDLGDGYYKVHGAGKFLKSDNGGLWKYGEGAGSVTGAAGMNIVPAGRLYVGGYDDEGEKAYFWTPNYVHPDGSGAGRRLILFENSHNAMQITNFRANSAVCIRCVRKATAQEMGGVGFTDETHRPVVLPDYGTGRLRVLNLGAGERWRIYNMLGVPVSEGRGGEGGETNIVLPPLPRGVYTLSTAQGTVKWIYR